MTVARLQYLNVKDSSSKHFAFRPGQRRDGSVTKRSRPVHYISDGPCFKLLSHAGDAPPNLHHRGDLLLDRALADHGAVAAKVLAVEPLSEGQRDVN